MRKADQTLRCQLHNAASAYGLKSDKTHTSKSLCDERCLITAFPQGQLPNLLYSLLTNSLTYADI